MLYVFVEGLYDELFLKEIFFKSLGDSCKFIEYSMKRKEDICKFINTIPHIPDSDYIFFGDADGDTIENKKTKLLSKYNALDINKIYIVQYEIESWYYAGVDKLQCQKLKLTDFTYNTDNLNKEILENKLPNPSEKLYYMQELINHFSKELAKDRNTSFKIFYSSKILADYNLI